MQEFGSLWLKFKVFTPDFVFPESQNSYEEKMSKKHNNSSLAEPTEKLGQEWTQNCIFYGPVNFYFTQKDCRITCL